MDIFQDSVFRDLEKVGFTVNESKVYLTLIHLGPSLAGSISKAANLDRSSTYNALEALVSRGIVATVHETKRMTFVPQDPKKIMDHFKEKEEIAAKIIPSLQERFKTTKGKKNVVLFQGYKGLKTVFQDILDSVDLGKEYLVMGSEGQFSEKMPYYAPLFRKLKEEKGIRTRLLVRKGRSKWHGGKLVEYREIPAEVVSPATINIFKDKVAVFIWEERPEAILIENKEVSKTFKSYFDFIWKHAKRLS